MTDHHQGNKPVLVIDDDDDFCASMRELLVGRGYRVEVARSGVRALTLLSGERPIDPFVIIVDLRMPDMDGYEFLAACQLDPRLREIPTIVVSAYGDPSGIEVDFIPKPVNVSRLLRSLEASARPAVQSLAD